jgi:uncharacterized protein YecT (DUF1311 family)
MATRTALIATLALACALAFPAGAADRCDDAQDQATMNRCASAAYQAADRELNAAYEEIRGRLASMPETARLLRDAQRAWIAFRDSECTFATSSAEGGSIQPMLAAQCAETLTRSRTDMLNHYLACEEGDLSCPVPPE